MNRRIYTIYIFILAVSFIFCCVFPKEESGNACPVIYIETIGDKLENSKILLQNWQEQEKSHKKYVNSTVKIVENGRSIVQFNGAVKVRGNGSSGKKKKSYGIKSNNSLTISLQGQIGQSIKTNKFCLISCENLNTFVGFYVSDYLQKLSLPSMCFVDVNIDGDYKGNYILMESLYEVLKKRLPVGGGCFVENDLYWDREGEIFFDTLMPKFYPQYNKFMKYTVKYPFKKSCATMIENYDGICRMQKQINDFELSLQKGGDCFHYIDINSFVNWLLVQDVLRNKDGAGSNMFIYTSFFSTSKQERNNLRMGPTWDYEYIMNNLNGWSAHRHASWFYFRYLVTYPKFQKIYFDRWREVRKFIGPYVVEQVHKLYDTQGAAIQKSWSKEAKLLGRQIVDLHQEVERVDSWFDKRIKWLDDNIKEP